jgi:signal transduction histidine kinase
MHIPRSMAGYLAIAGAAAVLGYAIHVYSWRDFEALKVQYVEKSKQAALVDAQKADTALNTIYQSLRTLAALPGIRAIDRHATNLGSESRIMAQQVYNNLANSVAVSEVYIVPSDFDPERTDPATGMPETPIIMFDDLILNASAGLSLDDRLTDPDAAAKAPRNGPEEVEIHEYRAFATQMAWFRQHVPEQALVRGLHVPLASSREVITCDNTEFLATGQDADRMGVLLSVPFFGSDGTFRGAVSAVIRSNALRRLLPNDNYVLVNAGSNYSSGAGTLPPHILAAKAYVVRAQPDPHLIFSAALPVGTADASPPWTVWVGYPDSAFLDGPQVEAIKSLQFNGYCLVLGLVIAGFLSWHVITRDFAKSRAANTALTKANAEALRAESEALAMAEEVRLVNEGMAQLNRQLESNMKRLAEAQDEVVRRSKMAQLGQLTATVAHEIRNPLAAVRTSAFLIKRKIKGKDIGIGPQIERIESGIIRCDAIITQLLDFARGSLAQTTEQDLDSWIEQTLAEEAKALPAAVAIECDLGLAGDTAHFDPARLQRALINLLSNSAEAMVGKGDDPSKFTTANPTIRVSSERTGRGFEISVADNGPGIAPDVMAKIFEPLFTTKSFGTGLGIPAVEKIMEQHGGRLEVDSKPGEGARFTLIFPGTPLQSQAA